MTKEELDKLEAAIKYFTEDENGTLNGLHGSTLINAASVYLAEQRQGGGAVDLLERPYMVDYEPTLGELTTLWDVVVRQDTPELQASFTVNYLRGVIKISPEMKVRLRSAHPPAVTGDRGALDTLGRFRSAVDRALEKGGWMLYNSPERYVRITLSVKDALIINSAALTNSVPGDVIAGIALALRDSRCVFERLKHNKPDDHPYHLLFENCDKALRELEPWVKGVE